MTHLHSDSFDQYPLLQHQLSLAVAAFSMHLAITRVCCYNSSMLQIKVKGNKKSSRFFIDSIKLEINNHSDSLRLLRLKTLPENKQHQIEPPNHVPLKLKQHTSIEHHSPSPTHQQSPIPAKVERWKDREEYRLLCHKFKDKRSRLSQKYQTIDNPRLPHNQNELRQSHEQVPHSVQPLSRAMRQKMPMQQTMGKSIKTRIKSHFRHQSLLPLQISQSSKGSTCADKPKNSYLIRTPQNINSLSYKQILEGHCYQLKPEVNHKHFHFKPHPETPLLREPEINLMKLRSERKRKDQTNHRMETNLSPWRTRHSRFPL